ncbi:MAG TPA: ABC transporter ATP-binding protein [Actinomycetota bacterium]|jgi:ABC-2 type transport system ATP-binding protein
MSPRAIEVEDLHKSYGGVQAVRGVDLHVDEGEIFALLGPNGAGKTTTVEILEGHRKRSSGRVEVLGHDPGKGQRAYKERIGIVLQETGVEPFLTVAEVIDLYRGYYPHPRPLDEIIELVGLGEKRDARVNKLSGGQRRRLDVAVGLAGDPDLLFLDEPTTGFDPSARRNAWEVVRNLVDIGKTVFLTTHYMDEAQTLADRVAIIVDGKIVAEGPPGALQGSAPAATTIEFSLASGVALPPALGADGASRDGAYVLTTDEPLRVLHDLTGWALDNDVELEGLAVARPSLEDVYLQLTAAAEAEEHE